MKSNKPTIKATNHRVHPCPNDKKLALVHQLITQHPDEEIIVVTSGDTRLLEETFKDTKVFTDKTLIKDNKDLKCTLLISFDVPLKAVVYIARLSHTTSKAVLLLNESEQKLLYPIETLLGRTIKQDIISGFEYETKEKSKKDVKLAKKPLSKEKIKSDKSNRYSKKKKAPNKFLGKDENGKAIFSGKSGDRNHRYDGTPKDKYDTPKKTGRKINIKALNKKKD